jgi:hypothetical protein
MINNFYHSDRNVPFDREQELHQNLDLGMVASKFRAAQRPVESAVVSMLGKVVVAASRSTLGRLLLSIGRNCEVKEWPSRIWLSVSEAGST